MRSLFIHISALNDDEYTLFTTSFADLVASDVPPTTDDDFEKHTVSIREARAWLRGRYADLHISDLDDILRLFSPSSGQDTALVRGQFFAILRLVLHVRSGAEFDRNLVFKQVHLNPLYNEPASPTRPVNDRPSRPFSAPSRRRQVSASGGTFDAPTSDTNPFNPTDHVHDHPQPPIHPDIRTGTVSSPTIVPAKPSPLPFSAAPPAHPHHSSNPFVARAAAVATRSSPSPERRLPPLPPRKVPPVLPPRSHFVLASTPGAPPKSPPPQLPTKVPHLTTALMQQSLQASKAGQEAKRLEAQREQERVLQVLKSSTRSVSPPKRVGVDSASSHSSLDGGSGTIPVLPPRRRVSPPASVTSTRSFEQVAGASITSYRTLQRSALPLVPRSTSRSRSRSPSSSRPTTDLPPPLHPDRKTSLAEFGNGSAATVVPSSPSPRFGRSKSINHPSPPPVPRRRRPDSVQLLSSRESTAPPISSHTAIATSSSTPSPTFPRLARHLSLSTREPLWDDMRDTLSAVRYKAEAGLSRRGWVPGLEKEERLIAERRESGEIASSSEDGLGVDAESPPGEERSGSLDRDEMKWPAGNGWSPLP
ncbi:hypothetical protein F5148DRAFT_1212416 [Russula earlei]|uniref:Uncharacterized protein n=1 Tax=Russula earlei TaxID=71964 RepID=A0ACC0U4D1_9AGAM|nr:hypothetical protein F5148DRAFT_1212416 [Russula earlei]